MGAIQATQFLHHGSNLTYTVDKGMKYAFLCKPEETVTSSISLTSHLHPFQVTLFFCRYTDTFLSFGQHYSPYCSLQTSVTYNPPTFSDCVKNVPTQIPEAISNSVSLPPPSSLCTHGIKIWQYKNDHYYHYIQRVEVQNDAQSRDCVIQIEVMSRKMDKTRYQCRSPWLYFRINYHFHKKRVFTCSLKSSFILQKASFKIRCMRWRSHLHDPYAKYPCRNGHKFQHHTGGPTHNIRQ